MRSNVFSSSDYASPQKTKARAIFPSQIFPLKTENAKTAATESRNSEESSHSDMPITSKLPVVTPVTTASPSQRPAKVQHCNCKRSGCLKLYCECFATGVYCNEACNCYQCLNNVGNEAVRKLAIESTLERNPTAFRSKSLVSAAGKNSKGCNCKKSGCLKKYCECFQAGIACGSKCKCQMCKNYVGNPDRSSDSVVPSSPRVTPRSACEVDAHSFRLKATGTAGKRKAKSTSYSKTTKKHTEAIARNDIKRLRKRESTIMASVNPLEGMITRPIIENLCDVLILAAASELSPDKAKERAKENSHYIIKKEKSVANTAADSPASSPEVDALLCEETSDSSLPPPPGNMRNLREEGLEGLLYSDQERAVLEEFSAFIRRIASAGANRS